MVVGQMDGVPDTNQPSSHQERGNNEHAPSKRNSSYQRNYRACYSCRQKKIRCDLGDPNDPLPPCAKCKREKKNCVLIPGGRGRGDTVRTRKDSGPRSRISVSRRSHDVAQSSTDIDQATPQPAQYLNAPTSEPPNRVFALPRQATGVGPDSSVDSYSTDACSQSIVDTVVRNENDALRLLFDNSGPLESETMPISGNDSSSSIEHGVLRQLPELTSEQALCWRHFPPCLQRFVTPAEVVAYLNYFFAVLNNQMPILSDWFSHDPRRRDLLVRDTLLCYTILTVSSRYLILPGHNGVSRGYLLHEHFFKYVQEGLQGLLWGASFGSQNGMSLVGTIESLVLLTQWQPRGLHMQTSSFELSKIALASAEPPPSASDSHDGDSNLVTSSAALRADMMCWRLANLAVTLAFENGIFDEQPVAPVTAVNSSGHSSRIAHLQQLLHIYVSHLAARLKRPNPLASVSVARIKQNVARTTRPQNSMHDPEWCPALNMWLDLLELGNITMETLYSTSRTSTNIASKERQESVVRHLASATLQWKTGFEALDIPMMFRLSVEVEYHYLRILIHSVGLQSEIHRVSRNTSWPSHLFDLGETTEEPLLQEVRRSCCKVYEIIVTMHKAQALRLITAPFLLRLVTVSMFGFKLIALGETENDNLTSLLDEAIAALRQSAVDDLHLAGYYASLLEHLARKSRKRSRPSCNASTQDRTRWLKFNNGPGEQNAGETFAPEVYSTVSSDHWDDWLAFQFDPTLAVIGDVHSSNIFTL